MEYMSTNDFVDIQVQIPGYTDIGRKGSFEERQCSKSDCRQSQVQNVANATYALPENREDLL